MALAIVLVSSTCVATPIPQPTATATVCDPNGQFPQDVAASYPPGRLADYQQRIVGGVGTDRLQPLGPAIEYLAEFAIANGANTATACVARQSGTVAVAIVTLTDGQRVRVNLYQPFPNNSRPIWAVRSYAIAP